MTPDQKHISAVAAGYDPEAYDDTKKRSTQPAAVIQWAARRHMATEAARALLTSTDAAVLDAMQDALVRAGRLRESLTVAWDGDQPDMSGQPQRARAGSFRSRETADRAAAYYRTRGRDAVVERCLVTDWQEIPDE